MNYRKRAKLYMTRKKGKTLSLFLFILVVSTFLITCFAILNASGMLAKDIRESLGGAFYLRANNSVVINEDGESEIIENRISITDEVIGQILSSGNIAYYNPINYGYAKSVGLEFIPGSYHSEENNMGQVTALRYSALAKDFTDEVVSLASGRHIRGEDTNAIMISVELAAANNLSVGASITLESAELASENGEYVDGFAGKKGATKVTVVGIYSINAQSVSETLTVGKAENMIYASLDVLTALNESEEGVYTGEVDFYVTDPSGINTIVSAVQQIEEIDWTTHFIRINDFQYSQVSDSLLSMGNLVKILLICASVVSTAILVLILILRMRGRVCEMGVLQALGITKKEIEKQLLLENILVSFLAMLVSYVASLSFLSVLEHYLFADFQLNLVNEDVLNGISGVLGQVENYLSLGWWKTLLIYLCEILVIAGAVLIASSTVMRLKPKEILSKMS